jgi:protein-tyrosine phosphatase
MGVRTVIDLRDEREMNVPSLLDGVSGVKRVWLPLMPGDGVGFLNSVGLGRFYIYVLKEKGSVIKEILREVLRTLVCGDCVLIHCVAGKDRTGIVSALLLMIAGVNDCLVVRDYAETDDCYATFLKRGGLVPFSGGPESKASAENMQMMVDFLNYFWGGVWNYLDSIGLSEGEVRALSDQMIVVGGDVFD